MFIIVHKPTMRVVSSFCFGAYEDAEAALIKLIIGLDERDVIFNKDEYGIHHLIER